MSTEFLLVTLALIMTLLGGSYFLKTRGPITHSNFGKNSILWLFFLVVWVGIISVALVFLPHRRDVFYLAILVWGVAGFIFWFVYLVKVYKFQPPPASILYVPLYVKAWFFSAIAPRIVKMGTTSIVKLSLIEKVIDLRMKIDTEKDLEEQAKEAQVLRMNRYEEEAMVESGVLLRDRLIIVKVTAPGFRAIPEIQTTIDDLVRAPVNILLLPQDDGEHALLFDFLDASSKRCGGFVLPVSVREKSPLFSQRALRTVQIIATILGMAAALKLIVDAIKSFF